jgi:transposase
VEHIGIDLGGRQSQICVRSTTGEIIEERKYPTAALAEYLGQRPASRVVVESCAESVLVANQAIGLGHEVRVVPTSLVPSLGVGARKTKNDRRDARVLSEVSCRIDLPSVHIPSPDAQRRKAMCGMREALVACRTKLINTVRGWLRLSCAAPRTGESASFPVRVRELAETMKLELPGHVERQLLAIEHLCEQIAASDRELAAEARASEVCRRLMTVPGIGPVTSVRFVAALDEQSRFTSAQKVAAYLGLVPGENSSGERVRRIGITKAGSSAVRRTLVNAAWVARRYAPNHPMVIWCLEVEKRRGKFVAITALARKLAGIMFAMWRDGTTYSPLHGSRGPQDQLLRAASRASGLSAGASRPLTPSSQLVEGK